METEWGKYYLVEIEYPVNVPQSFDVGIVVNGHSTETDFCGDVSIAANIHIEEEIVQDIHAETTATHQFLFWAAAESHKLVLINRQPNHESLFRNVRISRITLPGQQDDQRLPKLFEETAQRKRIGQITGVGGWRYAQPDMDWWGAYLSQSHLINSLHRGGYDGVTLTVLSKHGSLYPTVSDSLNSLEMMFRRFNNNELTLIPAIEFDLPIPSLEQLLAQHPGLAEEILTCNPHGGNSHGSNPHGDGLIDRKYNVLHPAVQQAMAEIVLDLVNRFSHHSSWGGVAIVLSPETYSGLPFAFYPPDDYTFAQFKQEMEPQLGVAFPDEQQLRQTMPMQQYLTQKHSQRMEFLQSNPKVRETWNRWRAAKVSGFYADLAQQVAAKRADTPLYLLGGTMLDQPAIEQFCVPTLPQNYASLQAMQLLGFDLKILSKAESLQFLRPAQIGETKKHRYDALNSVDTVSLFSQSGVLPGVQFVHTDTDYFVTTPVHFQSRKRFVRQLAQADVMMFMDGGVSLPFGQEPAMFDLLDTYRRLPPVPFQTFQPAASASHQPLTIRTQNFPDKFMVYIVNDAPFAVEADFFFSADPSSTMTELTGHRMIRSFNRTGTPSHTWRTSLQPYDLLAVHISDPNASIASVNVHCPPSLCGAEGVLRQKVSELTQRIHAVRGGAIAEGLINGDFELPAEETIPIVGWQWQSLSAQLDHAVVGNGRHSVRLTNSSDEAGLFFSWSLQGLSSTERMGVSMLVGVPADCKSLPMDVVLVATHRGESLRRDIPVGETLMPYFANVEPKNGVRWHRLLVPLERERLPQPLEELRIGVQYAGKGTVWLDDIAIHQALFSPSELVELQKMLAVADQRFSSGRFSHLMTLLEDHWSQFLFEHVRSQTPLPTASTPKPSTAKETSGGQTETSGGQTGGQTEPKKSPTLYQRMRGWFGS